MGKWKRIWSSFYKNVIKKKKFKSYLQSLVDRLGAEESHRVTAVVFHGLLVDYIGKLKSEGTKVDAIIRGLRNGQDFEMEKTHQYYNEDLGMVIPTYYVVSDRNLVHVSSSAIRMIKKLKGL